MKERGLFVSNIDELAQRWQIPVERVQFYITDMGMDPAKPEDWGVKHWDFLMQEQQKYFDESLFPRHLRPEPTEAATGAALVFPAHVAVKTDDFTK